MATFRMAATVVDEAVGLFGPVLYHKEPYKMFNEGAATLEIPKAAEKTPALPKPPFNPPPVRVGDVVMWRPDPHDYVNACPAVVTRVSQKEVRDPNDPEGKKRRLVQGDTIAVSVITPDREILLPKDGVRHFQDPNWTQEAGVDGGVWFHRDGNEAAYRQDVLVGFAHQAGVSEAQNRVIAELTARVVALEGVLTDPPKQEAKKQ